MPDGSTVSTTARVEPVQFAGTTVGTLSHPLGGGAKSFSLVAVDARGTSLSDAQGVARPASPFGDRVTHPNVAGTVDYASNRFDADLGLIRMGLRDYDPHLSRFTTPDPLLIEDLGKCRGHAVDCTLYAYARNNPLVVVDPTGQAGFSLGVGGSAAAGVGPGIGASVEFGVLVDVSNFSITPYGSFGGVLPGSFSQGGSFVWGASAGLSASLNYVQDTSQFFGNGTQLSLATGVALGGQGGLAGDNVNSGGLSYGKLAAGLSLSSMSTVTVDMNPFNAQEVQYAPGDPNAGNAYPPGEQQGESAPVAPSPTDSAPGAAPSGPSQDDAPNFTPATQDSSALTCSASDDGGGDGD
jgi:RHS repeat-associated protein